MAAGMSLSAGRQLSSCPPWPGEAQALLDRGQKHSKLKTAVTSRTWCASPCLCTSGSSTQTQAWDADAYRQNCAFVAEGGLPVLALLNPQRGERILDLGCGDGKLTAQLVQAGCSVVGVDASESMVHCARMDGLDARLMDGHELGFLEEFDAVFSNAALHWMTEDPDKVLAGVRRSLKPGGRFVGEFGGFGNVAATTAGLLAVLKERGINGAERIPWYFPTANEYRQKLESQGFSVMLIDLIPRPTLLPAGLANWYDTFADNFFMDFSPDERKAAQREATNLLKPVLCDKNGNWYSDYVRLRFSAIAPT
eukprot:SM000002S05623  [mRNA]  locus=s2:1205096:1206856:- [translate_table: standard]